MTRWRAVVTVCVWLALCVSLAATDARPAVLALGGIVAVVAAVILVMFDLAKEVIRVEWIPPRRLPRSSSRGSDPRVGSLRHQLHDARWFGSTELRTTLVDLVDDRLLAHHHIDRATDSAAAMEALTPALRQLVVGSRRASVGVRQLGRIVADIESL
jgi:hypothetical protein